MTKMPPRKKASDKKGEKPVKVTKKKGRNKKEKDLSGDSEAGHDETDDKCVDSHPNKDVEHESPV